MRNAFSERARCSRNPAKTASIQWSAHGTPARQTNIPPRRPDFSIGVSAGPLSIRCVQKWPGLGLHRPQESCVRRGRPPGVPGGRLRPSRGEGRPLCTPGDRRVAWHGRKAGYFWMRVLFCALWCRALGMIVNSGCGVPRIMFCHASPFW